jgi:transcriptional regulator GlxA family with amidase domain
MDTQAFKNQFFQNLNNRELGVSPLKFIIKCRIKSACKALATTKRSIEQIALSEGFYNAGAFITHFKNQINILPKEYRKRYYRSRGKTE